MSSPFPLGPSDAAEWKSEAIGGDTSHPLWLQLLPDAGNTSNPDNPAVFYVLPTMPRIARSEAGDPVLSLVLVLSHMPDDDETIIPLVERGQLSFKLDLSVPPDAIDTLQAKRQHAGHLKDSFRPLFARSILATLDDGPRPLASSSGIGSDAQLAFSVALSRAQSLEVLNALNGVSSDLELQIDIGYRAITPASPAPASQPVTVPSSTRPGSAYAGTTIIEETTPTETLRTVEIQAALHEVLGGILSDGMADRFIRLVALDDDEVEPREVPARVRERETKTRGGDFGRVTMFARKNETVALANVLAPNMMIASVAHAQLNAHTPQLAVNDTLVHWQAHDYQVIWPTVEPALEALPVVVDQTAPLWPDRVTATEFWYAPQFSLVQPRPNDVADTSPYRFSFVRVGHNAAGVPGLEAAVQFTLVAGVSAATEAAIAAQGNPTTRPVEILDLAVYFLLPFRDQSGTTRVERFTAETVRSGDSVTATVRLIDDWVRLAYGALAIPGYQAQSAQVVVSYCYRGYAGVRRRTVDLRFDARDALIAIRNGGDDGGGEPPIEPYFDAVNQVYRHPRADVKFLKESVNLQRGDFLPVVNTPLVIRPEIFTPVVPEILIDPHLPVVTGTELVDTRQTFGVNQALDVVFACGQFGGLYVDATSQPAAVVGCQDAFELGQTRYRQYERIDDAALQNPYCTVYRSLQQVGLFLVVPRRYCVTRFAQSEGERAFRPVIYLYSVTDSTTAASRCDFAMTLEPDIPGYVERDLLARLKAYATKPTLIHPTEIESQITYAWSLVEGGGFKLTPAASPGWNSFQVTLSTDLLGALQVQAMLQLSGISAAVTFALPDGTSLRSSLQIDLNNIVGPSPASPLVVERDGSSVRMTNPIERTVNVLELALYPPNADAQYAAVDQPVTPDASIIAALPAEAGQDWEIWPVYTVAPGSASTLAEIRSFIEDIRLNVIVVNLIDLASRGLKGLRVEAQLPPDDETYRAEVNAANPTDEIRIVLPLTTYLAQQVLQYRIARVATDGTETWTPVKTWNLETAGHVISLTWDFVNAS